MTNAQAMSAAAGLLDRACRALEIVSMLMLGVMTTLIVAQIAARDVLRVGAPWAEELARYAGLGLVYLVLPLLLLQDKHIRVDLLVRRLKGVSARIVQVANEVLTVLFCVMFLWGGWLFMRRAAHFTTPALSMPNWLFYLPAFVGMAMLTLVAALRLVRVLRGTPPGEGVTP